MTLRKLKQLEELMYVARTTWWTVLVNVSAKIHSLPGWNELASIE